MLFFVQGGITEEQMLNFMGANTSLSPLQAKDLLEVSVVQNFYFASLTIITSFCIMDLVVFLLIYMYELMKFLFQDEEVGFAYISQREARPSLYGILTIYSYFKLSLCTFSCGNLN